MTWFLALPIWLAALVIFSLRVVEMAIDTLRMLLIIRGRRGMAWILGLIQSLIFVVAVASVLNSLTHPATILAFAAGFATGSVLGMYIEEGAAVGYTHLRMISSSRGAAIAGRLRQEGFAVTEMSGRGKDGMVTILNCSVIRRRVDQVAALAKNLDQNVFITAEDLRPLRRGFWRA